MTGPDHISKEKFPIHTDQTDTGKRPRRAIKFRLHTNFPLQRVWNIVLFFYIFFCVCTAHTRYAHRIINYGPLGIKVEEYGCENSMHSGTVVLYLYTLRYNAMRCITTLWIKPNEPVKGGELRNGAFAISRAKKFSGEKNINTFIWND